jgi:hypothetical protein
VPEIVYSITVHDLQGSEVHEFKGSRVTTKLFGVFQPGTLNPWPRPGSDVNAFIPAVTTD